MLHHHVVRIAPLLGAVACCSYVMFFRIHDVDQSFAMLSEQIRDWSMAQRAWSDLPIGGPRSLNSGVDIGPAYYWFLWAARAVMSPVWGDFPHTGALAIALLQTLADFVLFLAIWRRLGWILAAVVVLAAGSSPYDAGLSASVWNPPVAVAFSKFALGAVLWHASVTTTTSVVAVVCAWLAVQMHVSAIVIAAAITAWVSWAALRARDGTRVTAIGAALAASIAVIALPYYLHPLDPSSGGVARSLSEVIGDPVGRVRVVASAMAVGRAADTFLFAPWASGWSALVLLAAAAAVVAMRRDAVAVATTGVLATATAVYSLWQGDFTELYWFAVLIPSAALCLMAPVASLPMRWRTPMAAAVLVIIATAQPARATMAWTRFRLPEYGPLLEGARSAAGSNRPIRELRVAFAVPQGMDPLYLFSIAGGRLDAGCDTIAVIQRDGTVAYHIDR
jgi:hypothetical protein